MRDGTVESTIDRLRRLGPDNLVTELPVAPWEAVLGARVTVPTLDGQVELRPSPPAARPGGNFGCLGKGCGGVTAGRATCTCGSRWCPRDRPLRKNAYAVAVSAVPRRFANFPGTLALGLGRPARLSCLSGSDSHG